jgi:hypothetical protein
MKARRIRWAGHVARMRVTRNAYNISVGKPEGRIPRHGWEDNIRMNLREIGWEGVGRMQVAHTKQRTAGPRLLKNAAHYGRRFSDLFT